MSTESSGDRPSSPTPPENSAESPTFPEDSTEARPRGSSPGEPRDAGHPDEEGLPGFPAGFDVDRAAALLRWAGALPEPGEMVGRYRILRPLGRGGMGVVHLAHDPLLDRKVALKFLPVRLADAIPTDGSPSRGRLAEEARAVSALDHPHIGTIYEIGHDDLGRQYMAMASYEGGTLRERLAGGPLPFDDAVSIAQDVAEGLHAAHEHGIVHRDIKPENLVFDHEGSVRIVDFGIAGSTRDPPSGPTSGGTTAYMSPEQREGRPTDRRTDLWSLGVVLHEMLTGTRPSSQERPTNATAQPPPSIPGALAPVVARALEPDPDHRYPTVDAFRRALDEAVDRTSASRRKRRRFAIEAGLAIVGIALVLGGLFVGRELPRVIDAEGTAVGAFGERARVLVADFETVDGFDEVSLAAREALIVDLQQSRFVTALTRAQMGAVLQRMGYPADTIVQGALAMEIAQRVGVGAVIEGTFARAEPGVVVSGRALDPRSGSQYFSVRATAGSDHLLGAVEELSREMRRRLGESRDALAGSLPLPEVTTHSIEALRLYAEADRAMLVDNERVWTLLTAALDRDSTFAMAHRLASAAANNRLSFSEAGEHMERAWRFRHRLPEHERLHLEGIYAATVLLDPERAAETFVTLLERYPDDSRAANNLASIRHSWLSSDEDAARGFLHALELEPDAPFSLTQGTYLHFVIGDRARADSLAERARAIGLSSFADRWEMARSFAIGQVADAWSRCERIVTEASTPIPQADDLEICGSIDIASGRLEIGTRRLERALEESLAQRRLRNAAHAAQSLAMAELLRGDREGASARLLDFLDRVPAGEFAEPDRFITRTNFQLQAILMGDPATASAIAAHYPPHPEPDHWFTRASDALVRAAHQVRAGTGAPALETLDGAFPPGVAPIGYVVWKALLTGMAMELVEDLDGAERAFAQAADPGRLPLPYLTKDRIHLPVSLEALLRVQLRAGALDRAERTRDRLLGLLSEDALFGAAAPGGSGTEAQVRPSPYALAARPPR